MNDQHDVHLTADDFKRLASDLQRAIADLSRVADTLSHALSGASTIRDAGSSRPRWGDAPLPSGPSHTD